MKRMKRMKDLYPYFLIFGVIGMIVLIVATQPLSASEKKYQIKLASHWPVMHDMNNWGIEFARLINLESKGRIDVTYYPAGMLAGSFEKYEKVRAGVTDIVNIHVVAHPGALPLIQLATLPFLFRDGTEANWVLNQMSDIWESELEAKGLKHLFVIGDPNFQILLKDKKVNNLEDMKGLRLRCGGIADEALKLYGTVPVKLKHTDLYLGMQRGTVDGIVFPLGAARAFKLQEVSKYCLSLDFFTYPLMEAMNLKTWNRLPKDLQDAVMRASEKAATLAGFHYQDTDGRAFADFRAAGVEVYELDKAELNRFKNKVAGVKTKMVADLEKEGLPGKKTMARMEELIKIYRSRTVKLRPTYP